MKQNCYKAAEVLDDWNRRLSAKKVKAWNLEEDKTIAFVEMIAL